MGFFEKIDKVKVDFPRLKTIEKEVGKYEFNGYQRFAIVTYFLCILLGVVLGNLFPACSSRVSLYEEVCLSTEFNFFLMIIFLFGSLVLCLIIFAVGHIIELLTSISQKLSKR